MAWSKERGMAGGVQGSFRGRGKNFAFISEINPQNPRDPEAWEYFLQIEFHEKVLGQVGGASVCRRG